MSDSPVTPSGLGFREAIDAFLHDRLQAKLDKLSPDDPKRSQLIAEHQRGPWLENAAVRVKQIQAVTHSLKPIHPEARGTNLFIPPASLSPLAELGSHALGSVFATDVVGNAAALDVYKLLSIDVCGTSLLQALTVNDEDALEALNTDPVKASSLRDALVSLTAERDSQMSSHVRAKQVYWLAGNDASDDAQYHLLSPLYPTSLAQAVHDEIQDARFGEGNSAARQARRDGAPYDGVYREYRDLAVQKLGGTKPQNISQLNSERRGINYLLASLPPVWQSQRNFLPVNASSIFERAFGARPPVRAIIRDLKIFLLSDPRPNLGTRNRVKGLVSSLVDELVIYGAELSHQSAGWTKESPFEDLAEEEMLWLDPYRAELPEEVEFAGRWETMDWPALIAQRFGKWLNGQLRDKLPDVGYMDSEEWRRICMEEGFGIHELRRIRGLLDAPGYIPQGKTHAELTASRTNK